MTDAAPTYLAHLAERIDTLDCAAWDALIPRDQPQLRSDFLRAVERADMVMRSLYVVLHSAAEPTRYLAVAALHERDIDVLTFAPPWLSRAVAKLRHGPLQRLLLVRALCCGPVINNASAGFYLAPNLPPADAQALLAELIRQIDNLPSRSDAILWYEWDALSVQNYAGLMATGGYLPLPPSRRPGADQA